MTPLQFLELLWKGKPDDLYILIWTLGNKTSNWFRDLEAAAAFVERHVANVHVGVGPAGQDYGPTNRCRSTEVRGLAGFWADIDLRSNAHDKKPLPVTIEEALSIIPPNFPPTIILTTGNGLHAWWLFKEPWVFDNDIEREDASVLIARFQTLLSYNSRQRGWSFERLGDLARVMRIPGTVNAKDPNNHKSVDVYAVNGRRYNPSDFRAFLDDLKIPNSKTEATTAKEISEHFGDRELTINLDVVIPDELLSRWISEEVRFRHTWSRERHDLHDTSGSGYDMAVADFGMRRGLSAQQIVDLIIVRRRIHHEKPRTRSDYFQRTIAKATKYAPPSPDTTRPSRPFAPSSAGAAERTAEPQAAEGDPNYKATYGDVALWVEWLRGNGIVKNNAAEVLRCTDGRQATTLDDLATIFEPGALASLRTALDGDCRSLLKWWRARVAFGFQNRIQFPAEIVATLGPHALLEDPRVIVGTIHSVKGGEADVVYLLPDLSQAGDAQYQIAGSPRDSVIRVFYVGATRARETLYIYQRETAMAIAI